MNREIKFRAWDGKSMIFLTVEKLKEFNLNIYEGWMETGGQHPLMQFTGLRDKNGFDIYEGDILKEPPHTSYLFRGKGEVLYESDFGGFAVFGEWSKNQHHELLTCDVACDCEVIGNIHQHRELLDKNLSQC